MTTRDFAYWLQGLFELQQPKTLDERQTELIRQHLNLVFVHATYDPAAAKRLEDAGAVTVTATLPDADPDEVFRRMREALATAPAYPHTPLSFC